MPLFHLKHSHTSSIPIEKGVHQGGCCSSVYFPVIAEILALALKDNQEIEGITFQEIRNLLNQFADDMDIFSLCNEKSIRAIYSELERFRLQSGFTVSYDKTTLYRIGSLRHSKAQMYNLDQFRWSNEDISVLGITIAHKDLVQKNYRDICNKVKCTLNTWYNRDLSLIGKVQVVNALVASLFVYKMMVLPIIPDKTIKTIEAMIREYLWKGKKSKIALKILQNPKEEGGLNLVVLKNKDMSLKATWPQILYQEQEYAQTVYKIMRCHSLGEDIWRCSINPDDVKDLKIKNQFWADVLYAWCKYNYYQELMEEKQIIWYNSRIKIGGKMILWKDALDKGLKFVHQLFDQDGFMSYQAVLDEFGLSRLRYNNLKSAIPEE